MSRPMTDEDWERFGAVIRYVAKHDEFWQHVDKRQAIAVRVSRREAERALAAPNRGQVGDSAIGRVCCRGRLPGG